MRKGLRSSLPFCAHCGNRVAATPTKESECPSCGAPFQQGADLFCARCGTRVGQRVSVADVMSAGNAGPAGGTQVLGSARREVGPKLALLNDAGDVAKTFRSIAAKR